MEPVLTGQLRNRVAVLTFGALQVSIGILLVLLDIAAFIFGRFSAIDTVFVSGIWAGIFFILTGAFGIVAGQNIPPQQPPQSRRCYLIAVLVLSIFGLLIALVLTPIAAVIGPVGYSSLAYFTAGFVNTHAVLYGVMFVVNLGQLISASVSLHKLSPFVSSTFIVTTTTTAPREIAMAVQTHPAAVATSYNGYPPPYTGQQQAYVQQAVETHPK